jgi:hypothetical protein
MRFTSLKGNIYSFLEKYMFTERIRLDDSTENQLLLFRPKTYTNLMANNSFFKKENSLVLSC